AITGARHGGQRASRARAARSQRTYVVALTPDTLCTAKKAKLASASQAMRVPCVRRVARPSTWKMMKNRTGTIASKAQGGKFQIASAQSWTAQLVVLSSQ